MIMEKSQREALERAIIAYTKKHTKSAKAARDALIKEGIYTRSGRLAANYQLPIKKTA